MKCCVGEETIARDESGLKIRDTHNSNIQHYIYISGPSNCSQQNLQEQRRTWLRLYLLEKCISRAQSRLNFSETSSLKSPKLTTRIIFDPNCWPEHQQWFHSWCRSIPPGLHQGVRLSSSSEARVWRDEDLSMKCKGFHCWGYASPACISWSGKVAFLCGLDWLACRVTQRLGYNSFRHTNMGLDRWPFGGCCT